MHPETKGNSVMERAQIMTTSITNKGFTGIVVVLGLMALSVGVGAGLGLVDNEQGTVWLDVTLNLSAGVALLAGIWTIERSPLMGTGLVVFGVIVIGQRTLWTIAIPIVMAFVAVGAGVRAIRIAKMRPSLRAIAWTSRASGDSTDA